jgi:hypothetical protein
MHARVNIYMMREAMNADEVSWERTRLSGKKKIFKSSQGKGDPRPRTLRSNERGKD